MFPTNNRPENRTSARMSTLSSRLAGLAIMCAVTGAGFAQASTDALPHRQTASAPPAYMDAGTGPVAKAEIYRFSDNGNGGGDGNTALADGIPNN